GGGCGGNGEKGDVVVPDFFLPTFLLYVAHSLLVLIKGLNAHQDLLQKTFEESAHVAAHAYGLSLVIMVNFFANARQLVHQTAQLLMCSLGTLLSGSRRLRLLLVSSDASSPSAYYYYSCCCS